MTRISVILLVDPQGRVLLQERAESARHFVVPFLLSPEYDGLVRA